MFYFFPYIGNNHPNWRTHIFQMRMYTTNQIYLYIHTLTLQVPTISWVKVPRSWLHDIFIGWRKAMVDASMIGHEDIAMFGHVYLGSMCIYIIHIIHIYIYRTYRHTYIYIRDIILYNKTYSIGYNMKMDYFTKNTLVRCSEGRPDLDFSDAGPKRWHGWFGQTNQDLFWGISKTHEAYCRWLYYTY